MFFAEAHIACNAVMIDKWSEEISGLGLENELNTN